MTAVDEDQTFISFERDEIIQRYHIVKDVFVNTSVKTGKVDYPFQPV
jgi:hypothetical protein